MSNIRLLSEGCINQIAAGEVVERPCSVVKELAENSIDALASRIEVSVEGGGAPFIRVRDNGMGMAAEDIETAVLPHATSKIKAFEDLLTLDTLGFRGEALPSIASVSELEIVSRPSENVAGALCRWDAGVCVEQKTCGCPNGTTVTVRRLFENVPARLKFLKSAGTEFGLIADMIGKLAMTRPDIAFSLAHPERVVMQTSGNGDLRDVLAEILDNELARNLIQIGGIYEGLSVGGFIAPPYLVRSSKNFQTFIVNNRVVRSKVLSQALREGYHTYVPAGTHPAAVLVLALDQGLIDINVHPAKTEIKFHEERLIIDRLRETLRQALGRMWLGTKTGTPEVAPPPEAPPETPPETPPDAPREAPRAGIGIPDSTPPEIGAPPEGAVPPEATITDYDPTEFATDRSPDRDLQDAEELRADDLVVIPNVAEDPTDYQLSKKIDSLINKKNLRIHFGKGISISQFLTEESGATPAEQPATPAEQPIAEVEQELFLPLNENEIFFQSLRPLAQLFKTYIVAEGRDAFYLIDQHAAHERIRYEEFVEQAGKSESASQVLLTPIAVHLTLREEQAMLEYLPQLREMGFLVEDFGSRTYLLRGVPVGSGQPGAEEIFHRFLDEVLTSSMAPTLANLMEKWIFVLACRNSVKANDILSLAEMGELLRRLGQVNNPYSCPHGRPLIVPFSRQDLEKQFGR